MDSAFVAGFAASGLALNPRKFSCLVLETLCTVFNQDATFPVGRRIADLLTGTTRDTLWTSSFTASGRGREM